MDVSALEARVAVLEKALRRKESPGRRKGYTTQKGAAEYIGKSREFLRRRRKEGKAPAVMPDGSYAYEDLDAFMRGETAESDSEAA